MQDAGCLAHNAWRLRARYHARTHHATVTMTADVDNKRILILARNQEIAVEVTSTPLFPNARVYVNPFDRRWL